MLEWERMRIPEPENSQGVALSQEARSTERFAVE